MTPAVKSIEPSIPVSYESSHHRYSLSGNRYISATQLLERFIPKFDSDERSRWMAYRYGQTPQYWLDKWKRENQLSLNRGTVIHDQQEQQLYKQKFIQMSPANLPVLNHQSYTTTYRHLPDGVYPEMLLWHHDHQIAGRADKVIITTQLGKYHVVADHGGRVSPCRRYADVEDYKTNKRIDMHGFQRPDGTTEKMLDCLGYIENSEYWHYTLQLSIYQYMLEYHGLLPGYRRLIHFPHPIEGFDALPPPIRYDLPYLRDEVIAMIKHIQTA